MKPSHLIAIASTVLWLSPVAVIAQTPSPSAPSTPPPSTQHRTIRAPSPTAEGSRHTVDGEVTKVDAKKGWVDVKTAEGRMKLHFPPPTLQNVKAGDRVTIELGLTQTAAK